MWHYPVQCWHDPCQLIFLPCQVGVVIVCYYSVVCCRGRQWGWESVGAIGPESFFYSLVCLTACPLPPHLSDKTLTLIGFRFLLTSQGDV